MPRLAAAAGAAAFTLVSRDPRADIPPSAVVKNADALTEAIREVVVLLLEV